MKTFSSHIIANISLNAVAATVATWAKEIDLALIIGGVTLIYTTLCAVDKGLDVAAKFKKRKDESIK